MTIFKNIEINLFKTSKIRISERKAEKNRKALTLSGILISLLLTLYLQYD